MRKKDTDNERFARLNQEWLAAEGHDVDVDGWAGEITRNAWRTQTGFTEPTPDAAPWPPTDERSLIDFYGPPGESQLVMVRLPYPMRLAWDHSTTVERTQCHRKVAESLVALLEEILELYGDVGEVAEARMDLYGGCYNYRRQRGGRSWSLHAWGAAIDLDPLQNRLDWPWPDKATMPVEVIDLFESAGWTSGARAWGWDAMHFQATR